MTEEAAPYRAILDALGYPPIAGGAPEGDEDAEDTPTPDPGDSPDGTPANEPEGSGEPDTDWQQRYTDLQPEYTRASQEAARYRQVFEAAQSGDKEAQAALIAAAGYELPEDDDEDPETLTADERVERLEAAWQAEREAAQQAQKAQEQQELEHRFYETELEKLDPQDEWDDDYKRLVVSAAQNFEDDDGLPDLKAGHEALQAQFEAEFKKRVQSKRQPQAPSGASASHQPDLDDPEQRREYLLRRSMEQEPIA